MDSQIDTAVREQARHLRHESPDRRIRRRIVGRPFRNGVSSACAYTGTFHSCASWGSPPT